MKKLEKSDKEILWYVLLSVIVVVGVLLVCIGVRAKMAEDGDACSVWGPTIAHAEALNN